MIDKKYLLTVILPIYNGMPYLPEAIESLLQQSFQDFLILAIDNGSTDGTQKYLTGLNNKNIKYLKLKENNLVSALNAGMEMSDSSFIARMDADDTCNPLRFEKQVKFLQEHQEIDLLGTGGQYISADGKNNFKFYVPSTHEKIIKSMRESRNAIIHPSIMFRSKTVRKYGNYNVKYFPCEDYELFLRISNKIKFANLPEPLYNFRIRDNSIMTIYIKESLKLYHIINKQYSVKYLNVRSNKNINNYKINLLEYLDIYSVSLYRKGLYYYLNKNKILGMIYFLISALLNPSRLINAIKNRF